MTKRVYRGNRRPKLCSAFGCCPQRFFFKDFLLQKQCKYTANIVVAQIRGAILLFLWGKSAFLYPCYMLPSISKIISGIYVVGVSLTK